MGETIGFGGDVVGGIDVKQVFSSHIGLVCSGFLAALTNSFPPLKGAALKLGSMYCTLSKLQ